MNPITGITSVIRGFSQLANDSLSIDRLRRIAEVSIYSLTHIGLGTTTSLSMQRCGRFLSTASQWQGSRRDQLLLFRVEDGERIPLHFLQGDFPLGMMHDIFSARVYQSAVLNPTSVRTVVDCGANIGVATAWFLRRFPHARVHIFEPGESYHHCLRLNVKAWRADQRVILNSEAVWSSSTQKNLFRHSTVPGGDSLFAPEEGISARLISTIRLDGYLQAAGIETVDLLKLHIQGSELEALRGLGNRIRDIRVIVGAIHPRFVRPEEVRRFLEEAGFRIVRWNPSSNRTIIFEAVNHLYF